MRILSRLEPETLRGVVYPLAGWPTRGAVVRDLILWLVVGGAGVLGVPARTGMGFPELPALAAGAVGLSALVVALSRPFPLASLLIAVGAAVWNPFFYLAMMVAAYLVGRRMPRLAPAVVAFDVIAMAGIAYMLTTAPLDIELWFTMFGVFAFTLVLPWLVGVYRRQEQELAAAGWERAKRLEREHRIAREQARLRERSRIAQDMHDSLGHELSLIALRAGALEVAPDLDDRHRQGAGELRAHAMTATERLQEIIGILRERSDPVPLDPAGEGIAAVVERVRASGVDVTLERHGEAAELPPMVDRAVYRVVQEALTNATKHAPGAPVLVRVVHDAEASAVVVRNGPPQSGLPSRAPQGGSGLVALAERVRLAGGTFQAGADGNGGFAVRARFGHKAVRDAFAVGNPPDPEVGHSRVGDEMREAQRRSRRGFTALVAVGGVVTAVFLFTGLGVSFYQAGEDAIAPEQLERVEVGQERGEVEAALPVGYLFYTPPDVAVSPPQPDGALCVHYIMEGLVVGGQFFRVCYVADIVVAKDIVEFE